MFFRPPTLDVVTIGYVSFFLSFPASSSFVRRDHWIPRYIYPFSFVAIPGTVRAVYVFSSLSAWLVLVICNFRSVSILFPVSCKSFP